MEQAKAENTQQERAEKNKICYDAVQVLALTDGLVSNTYTGKGSKRLKIPYLIVAFLMQKAYFSSKGQH
jgi:hypothetical protein